MLDARVSRVYNVLASSQPGLFIMSRTEIKDAALICDQLIGQMRLDPQSVMNLLNANFRCVYSFAQAGGKIVVYRADPTFDYLRPHPVGSY